MTRRPTRYAICLVRVLAGALLLVALLSFPHTPSAYAKQAEPASTEAASTAADDQSAPSLEAEIDQQLAAESGEGDPAAEDSTEEGETEDLSLQERINEGASQVVGRIYPVLFFGIPTPFTDNDEPVSIPLILLVLVLGGITFTFMFGFVNIRLFSHAIDVIRGKFDRPEDEGEISHFQALTSALSATVGLGNIAGVAVAIATGGPGAVFWMWIIAFFGMSMKFCSCSFSQLYRRVKPDGTILGGPMVYLDEGMREHIPLLAPLGKIFGIAFALFTMLAAFGGGNMFQGNQSFKMVSEQFHWDPRFAWVFGLVLSFLVGLVIIGGIRRIGEVTSKLVPGMCVFYCLCCLTILGFNFHNIPHMFADIFQSAFSLKAGFGGLLGVLLTGATRAAFSNEAGLGSAAIAHAAARTKEPVREGVVAMVGPFIDTIIVCTMTALTILVTNAHLEKEAAVEGIAITSRAFSSLGTWAPLLLCLAVFVFAYSTMISWSYYGEKATEYLFGQRGIMPYRVVYVLVVILGPIVSLGSVVDFSDMMLLSMAFPNIIGMLILSGVIRPKVRDYIARLRSGEMKPVK